MTKTFKEMLAEMPGWSLKGRSGCGWTASVCGLFYTDPTMDGAVEGLHTAYFPTPDYDSMSTDELLERLPKFVNMYQDDGWWLNDSRGCRVHPTARAALLAYFKSQEG